MTEVHGSDGLEEFLENQDKPWWYYRCVHRSHAYWYYPDGSEYGCWNVLREAEQVAVLHLTCLHQVHLCTNIDGIGSSCKTLSEAQYNLMEDHQLLRLIQEEAKDLRSIAGM